MRTLTLLALFFFSLPVFAEIKFTILQTGDIHSHFTNHDSAFELGGLARVATKIQEIKQSTKNVLVLDAGDFTEGSIFFTDGAGAATYKIMEAIGYDAIVLGNHDWLIGPEELYKSLENSKFSLPILSANINLSALDPKINLSKYLKPYIVKHIDGLKVGILGLSTFQFIFDSFFLPVKLTDPTEVAKKYVDQLKTVEKCDVVILLSHLGYEADKRVAENVKGIDLIVGGHSHILFKNIPYVNGTPISHVGKWGQYLGQIDLKFNQGKTTVDAHKLYQIDPTLKEEPLVKTIIDGSIKNIEAKWGNIFNDKILKSEVDLPIKDYRSDNIMGHWVADGLRAFTKADIALENPSYASRDIFRGFTNTADFFNIFPNIFNPNTGKAWTVKTFLVSGLYAKLLVSGVFRAGLYLKMSNADVVLDLSKSVNQLVFLEVGGNLIDPQKMYRIAGTNGILEAIEFLKVYGIDVGVVQIQDTGVEAWRVAAGYIKSKSPITYDNVNWAPRIRTLQPDMVVRPEELFSYYPEKNQLRLKFRVRNTGYAPAKATTLEIYRTATPNDTLAERSVLLDPKLPLIDIGDLRGGSVREMQLDINTSSMKPGRYPITLKLSQAEGEMETENNVLDTYIDVRE